MKGVLCQRASMRQVETSVVAPSYARLGRATERRKQQSNGSAVHLETEA